MAAPPPRRPSASPEDGSDGNDSLSAPSEYLAEFLSAIMRRQYAEALKYCRLILQYEPHNATARGFYPLLRQKLDRRDGDSSSEEASRAGARRSRSSPSREGELMDESADESGSAGSCSSLSLDSSREASPAPASAGSENCGGSASSRTGGDPSTGSGTRSASRSDDVDDNGNTARSSPADSCRAPPRPACSAGDVENDNAGGDHDHERAHARPKPELDSLQRLRAQFARSLHCAD